MVTNIQLGTIFNSGGRNVVGGGSSGLDTQSLIEGLVAARQIPVKFIEDKVALNDKKSAAFSEFKTLLSAVKDSSDLLRNVPGFAKSASNAFSYVTGSVTSNTSVAGTSYMTVTVEPGIASQSFLIDEITQLAKAKKQTTGDFAIANADVAVVAATPAAGQFGVGTFTLNGVSITLEAGDSLNRVASKFNAVSDDSGVTATVIKLASNQFRLMFTATSTGEDANFNLGDPGDVTPVSVVDASNVLDQITFDTSQDAQNAEFEIDGQAIVRQTNNVDDVVEGITFNLLQATPALTQLNLEITPDTTVAKNAIITFINAYNDFRLFMARQTQLQDDGTFSEDSVLANNSTLRFGFNSMSSELSRIVEGIAGDDFKRLGDIGITYTDLQETTENPFVRNILTLDESDLDSALAANFEQVRKVFEFDFDSEDPNLVVFSRSNALNTTAITVNISPATSTYEATYTDATGTHTIDLDVGGLITGGYRLMGQAGTVLEGLTMLYTADSPATIDVTMSQGIGDRLYNLTNDMLLPDTGAIAVEIDAIKTNTQRLQEDIIRLNTQIESYRLQLITQFSQLESALSQVNSLLQALDAQAQARANG